MSTQLEINGVAFFPIKEAAKVVSYSRDYVAKLAREEKIVASQIGRQWYVDILSLKNFAEAALLEQEVRKQKLSDERKREQALKSQVATMRTLTVKKRRVAKLRTKVAAMAVLMVGVAFGAGVNYFENTTLKISSDTAVARLGVAVPADVSFSETGALPVVRNEAAPLPAAQPMPTALYTTTANQPVFVEESSLATSTLSEASGIFLLAKDAEVKDVASIAQLFSDPVRVEVEDGVGVVTYTDVQGEDTQYQFVTIPKEANSRIEI